MKDTKNMTHNANSLNSPSEIPLNEVKSNEALEHSEYLENDKLWNMLSKSTTKKPSSSFSNSVITHIATIDNQSTPTDNAIPISKWNRNKTWLSITAAAACVLIIFSYNTGESTNSDLAKQDIDSNSQIESAQVVKSAHSELNTYTETILNEDYLVALFESEDQIKDNEIYALLSF